MPSRSSLPRHLVVAFHLAFAALRQNALRAVLTALGILVGVAAVTIVVSLGAGASQAISDRMDAFGENSLTISPRETVQSGARDGARLAELTEGDAAALARDASAAAAAAPVLSGLAQIAWRDANLGAELVGTTLPYFQIRAYRVAEGELWSSHSEKAAEKVCVIGTSVRDELFGAEEAVGRTIRIGRHPFRVLGVLEAKGQTPFGRDQDKLVVLPIGAMRAKLVASRPGTVNQILLSAKSREVSERLERQATAILRQRHGLVEGVENDFRIRSQEEMRQTQERVLGILRALLLSVAAVSLAIGGIGVMNIMLVSVTERTREIGIRLAIGARERDILLQFLVEAIVLCVCGGAAGALLAGGAIVALADALNWPMQVSLQALAVALATSAIIGVTFGFLPARRAARLDPVTALRRE
ncbi:MAG TPA: ABC transporter permease [Polyangiaceae bacterium]|nr:ABC transporter permease [Polyangiaceae bacterium]